MPKPESAHLKTCMHRESFKTKNFEVSKRNLPKKVVLGMEFKKKQLSDSKSAPLNTTKLHLKQSTFENLDQTPSKKVVWERNLRKQLSNSESSPLTTIVYWVSSKRKHFEVSGPNLPKNGTLGTEFKKIIFEFRISILEYWNEARF